MGRGCYLAIIADSGKKSSSYTSKQDALEFQRYSCLYQTITCILRGAFGGHVKAQLIDVNKGYKLLARVFWVSFAGASNRDIKASSNSINTVPFRLVCW